MKSFNRFASWPNVFSASVDDDDNDGEGRRRRLRRRLLVKTRSLQVLPNTNIVDDRSEDTRDNFNDNQNRKIDDKMLFTNEELAEFGVNYDDFNQNSSSPLTVAATAVDDVLKTTENSNGVGEIRRKIDERYESKENLADYLIGEEKSSDSGDKSNDNVIDEIYRSPSNVRNENPPVIDVGEQIYNNDLMNSVAAVDDNGVEVEKEDDDDDGDDEEILNKPNNNNNKLLTAFGVEFERRNRSDRMSVPLMTTVHSWSHLDIPHSLSHPERLFSDDADDDVFDERFHTPLKKSRVASISSINFPNDDSENGTDTERVSQEKSSNDVISAQICESTKIPTLERLLSVSTPSINEIEPIVYEKTPVEVEDFERGDDVEQDFAPVPRQKTQQSQHTHNRAHSMITPRIPLMGMLPNSVRRASEKPAEKQKERRSGFFGQRTKSKIEKHTWVKINFCCDVCAKNFSDSEVFQCSDCSVILHSNCKDEAEKRSCTKNKNAKPTKTVGGSIKHQSSLNIPSKPPAVGRFASLREDSTEEKFDDTESRIISSDLIRSGLPSGFFASTVPHSDWNHSLNLWVEEPEPWSDTLGKVEKKKLSAKEIKRQNTIHDLYVTEKHHCQTLVVLKHTYFDEMALRCIVHVDDLHQMMPCLNDLLSVHMNFLRLLKKRKDESVVVGAIHDDILAQFKNEIGDKMIAAYTSFCSQKDNTVRFYNVLIKENLKFMDLISKINSTGFYKTLSLPDCLLRITQRLSKYHQFVESLRKNTADDSGYKAGIVEAETAVKNLIMAVDSGIDRIQMKEFQKKLYNEMDPRCVTPFGNAMFTPQDILPDARPLIYYANVQWPNAKRHPADVLLVVFSDVIVFLQSSHNKQYNFFNQDGKAGVVSIRKMIVRDKAGKSGSEGVYLIATHPKPEMYEVRCKTKKDNVALMTRIQKCVQSVNDDDGVGKEKETTPIDNNYQILEEVRKLHISLDYQKKEFAQFVEERQMDLARRERFLNEREAQLDREDNELRARWGALYHAWEQQRVFGGLPVSPLTPPMSNGTSPNSDLHTVAAPSIYYPHHPPQQPQRYPSPQYYPPPAYYQSGPPPPPQHQQQQQQQPQPTMLHYRQSSLDVPLYLQGSLLHGGGSAPVPAETPKSFLPSKLSNGAENLSSKFLRSGSKMKKLNSNNQVLPNKLSVNVSQKKN